MEEEDLELTPEEVEANADAKAALAALRKALGVMSEEEKAKLLLNNVLDSLLMNIAEGFATAADLGVAIRLLQNNDIGITPTRDNAAGKLKAKLEEASRRASTENLVPVEELAKVDIEDFMGGTH